MSEETIVPEINYEDEARKQNWVPKEEFRGKEEDWIDAKEFVERGKQINPILRANNERLNTELAKTKAEMAELRSATEEFRKFQKEIYEKKAAQLEAEIVSLREEKKAAISAGDGDRAVEIDDRIDQLKEEKASAKAEEKKEKSSATQMSVEVETWVSENKWYSSDGKMAAATNAIAETLRREKPYLMGRDFFDALDKELEDTFSPERLGRKPKAKSMVEGATSGSRPSTVGSSKKSYENLPADAKAACDKFVKSKLMTKEQYVAEYQWD